MSKIKHLECLVCGENLSIPTFINIDNYDGQVVCQNCKSLLYLRLVRSKVKRYKVVDESFGQMNGLETRQMLDEAEQSYGKIIES
jgi:transcription elongation factor Elf1